MSIFAPRRPPAPEHPRTKVERRRAQEALIKGARRRPRQRRRGSIALLLLGACLAIAIGPTHVRAGNARGTPRAADPAARSKAAARNGKIAFADYLGLQVVALDGTADVIAHCPRFRGCMLAEPAWSPDGRQIAYISGSSSPPPMPRGRPRSPRWHPSFSLYVKDALLGRVRRLATCGLCGTLVEAGGIAWSPDGARIALPRDFGTRGALSLWLVDTATGKLRRLTDCRPKWCADVFPAWAPNGQRIVFSRFAAGGSSLYTVRPDGSHLSKITNSRLADRPQWSPDGRQIAYDGQNKIFVSDADGSNRKLLFADTDGTGPGFPSWSPDGTKLAFFNTPSERNGLTGEEGLAAEVWTINPDGTGRKRIYHSVCCVENWAAPIWSPDGRKLAFATTSARGVFVIARDGSGLRRLSSASTSALSWQRLP